MRLIDGDALIEKFNEKTDMAECLVDARTAERFSTFCALADAVEEMPTVDAEVVVRCKDCKYLANAAVNSNGFLICNVSDMEITLEDFCSYGEKMDRGEENGRICP